MKRALSLRQPWAELILRGKKTIETRHWNTRFRGEFYIHASKTIDEKACAQYGMDASTLAVGAIVGKAKIVDVKEYLTEKEFLAEDGKHCAGFLGFKPPIYGFLLTNVRRVKPRACKGKLNFFKIKLN